MSKVGDFHLGLLHLLPPYTLSLIEMVSFERFFFIPASLIMCSFIAIGCNPKSYNTVTVYKDGKNTSYTIHIKEVKDSTSMEVSDFAKDFGFVVLETDYTLSSISKKTMG